LIKLLNIIAVINELFLRFAVQCSSSRCVVYVNLLYGGSALPRLPRRSG